MLTFAVVTSRSGRSLDGELLKRLGDITDSGVLDTQMATPVTKRALWTNPTKTIAALAWWSGHDPYGSGVLWHESPQTFTAMAGHGWPRGKGWNWADPWAPQLAELASTDRFVDQLHEFSGVFAACHLGPHGGTVFSDPFGLGMTHTGATAEYEVFSSRAAVAAHLIAPTGTEPRRDPLAAGWLAFSQVMVEDTTGYVGVDIVPECTRVDIDEHGATRRVATAHPTSWHRAGLDADEAIDLIREDLTAELTAISTMQGLPLVCDLTGGKDSRVILAVLLEAGIADRFEYFTSGGESLPDVQIAKTLRERYGLARHSPDPSRPPQSDWNRNQPADLWEMYRQFSFATSGMQTLWSTRRLETPRPRVSVNGIGGEPLYTNYAGSARLRKARNLHSFLRRGQKFGRGCSFTPEARNYYEDGTDRLIEGLWEGSTHVQDAVDKYYLKVRMRRWFGTGQEVDRINRLFPLFGAPSIGAAFGLGHELRQAQYIPFQLMSGTDRALVTMPFADDTWPERLMRGVDNTGIPADHIGPKVKIKGSIPGGTPGPRPRTNRFRDRLRSPRGDLRPKLNATRERRENRMQEQIELFRRVMVDDPENPLFTVVDHASAVDLIERYERLPHQLKQLAVGAFTAAVWLGEHDSSPHRP